MQLILRFLRFQRHCSLEGPFSWERALCPLILSASSNKTIVKTLFKLLPGTWIGTVTARATGKSAIENSMHASHSPSASTLVRKKFFNFYNLDSCLMLPTWKDVADDSKDVQQKAPLALIKVAI